MIKKIAVVCSWLLMSVVSVSVNAIEQSLNSKTTVDKVVDKKHDLPPFNAISLSGMGDLYITQADEQNLMVEAETTLLPLVEVSVRNKTLYLNVKNAAQHKQAKITYYLSIQAIQSIRSSSSSSIVIKDGLETDLLTLSLSNFGYANLNIRVKKLVAKIDGGAKLELQGSAQEQVIQIIGAGEVDAKKLVGSKAVVDIGGNGIVSAHVSDSLAASISGAGVLGYCGDPVLIKEISNNATVSALEAKNCQ